MLKVERETDFSNDKYFSKLIHVGIFELIVPSWNQAYCSNCIDTLHKNFPFKVESDKSILILSLFLLQVVELKSSGKMLLLLIYNDEWSYDKYYNTST
mgnify:CR=1